MNQQAIYDLLDEVETLEGLQNDMNDSLEQMNSLLQKMQAEEDSPEDVFDELKNEIQSINVDKFFSFLRDLEDKIRTLDYHYIRAKKMNLMGSFPKPSPLYHKR